MLTGDRVADEQRILGCEWESWVRAGTTGIEVPLSEQGWKTVVRKQICETCVDAVSMFGFWCSLSAPQSWLSLGTQKYQCQVTQPDIYT